MSLNGRRALRGPTKCAVPCLVFEAALLLASGAGCVGGPHESDRQQSAPLATTSANPVTYTGFTITDGKLGDWEFHQANVYLRFESDVSNVQLMQPVDPANPPATVDTLVNMTGNAFITVASGSKIVRAKFDPNQIFVSMDLGNTADAPHVGARGVGFGSFSATAPGGIEPAYPLGIEDGTVDWGDLSENNGFPSGIASSALANLPFDLTSNVALSGRAWTCLGFPDFTCPPPTTPLKTNKGDLFLYQPYAAEFSNPTSVDDPMGAGFFIVDSSSGSQNDVHAAALAPDTCDPSSTSITYNAYVVTDVTLGKHQFQGAEVYLSFDADTSTVLPLTQGTAHGYINSVGSAHVKIISGGHLYKADFDSDQLYVFYDVAHSYLGFGSNAGGFGYPLSLTAHDDSWGLTETSTLEAVSNIANGTVLPSYLTYSSATSGLATDLTNATALSGAASSCPALDPTTTICTNLTPVALKTNRGDFLLYEPYTADDTTTDGSKPFTINWGMFWTTVGGQ